MMDSTYYEALSRVARPIRATELPHTLEHMQRLLAALGNPQDNTRAVVVAGSTGKGTTCLRLAEMLSHAGIKVGLYTSPHLHSFRERMSVLQGARRRNISQAEFVEAAQEVFSAQAALGWQYSTFETTTALALAWFAAEQVEIAVLEVGIGGRFDAVNAVSNEAAIFTPIEGEHMVMLGGSLEAVAWHKAGIIQSNGQAFSVPQLPEVMAVLNHEAEQKQAELKVGDPLDFASEFFHVENVSTGASLPGRLERIDLNGHVVIIDGGHTAVSAKHLYDFAFDRVNQPIRMVVGMLRDKNTAAFLETFDAPNVQFLYTQAPGDRALTVDDLLTRYQPANAQCTLVPSLDAALKLDSIPNDTLTVVAGSLRMAAAAREAYGLLTAGELEEARLTRAIFEGDAYRNKLR